MEKKQDSKNTKSSTKQKKITSGLKVHIEEGKTLGFIGEFKRLFIG